MTYVSFTLRHFPRIYVLYGKAHVLIPARAPRGAREPHVVVSILTICLRVDHGYDVDPPVGRTPEPVQVAEWCTISAWRIIWPHREH
jgi:hypothetical protein